MNKSVCFIELIKDENGFFKGGQSIETACLRAYLKDNEIDSMVYIDEELPSINDMCDDILSLSDEVLVFIVNDECKKIMQILISSIKKLEDVEVVVIGDTLEVEDVIYIDSDSDKKLIEILKSDANYGNKNILSVSPYAKGILLPRDINNYGIWLGKNADRLRNVEVIKEDIKEAVKIYSGLFESEDKVIPFKGAFIENGEFLRSIIEELREINIPFLKFLLPIHESNFDEILKISKYMPNCIYSLKFESVLNEDKINKFKELIQSKKVQSIYIPAAFLVEKNEFISMILLAQKANLLNIFPMGEVDSKKMSLETASIVLKNTRSRYLPFFRGFVNSKIGAYESNKLDGYIKHLEISNEFINKNKNDFLNEIMKVNSSVYIKDKKVDMEDGKWFFNEVAVANVVKKEVENIYDTFSNENTNISNFLYTVNDRLYNGSLAYASYDKIYEMSYKEGKKSIAKIKQKQINKEDEIYIFKLTDKEDFDLLLEDAEMYKESHKLTDFLLGYGYLENSCRFLYSLICSVDKIPRAKIDSEGNIRTCDMLTEPISKVGDSIFEIEHNCMTKREKRLNERGCYSCPSKSWCCKCIELPEFIDSLYCDIMKKKPYIIEYVIIPFIFIRLRETNRNFRDAVMEEVRVSNEYMYNYIPSELKGNVAPYLPKSTSVLTIKGKYLMWSPTTYKYYNVSIEFVYVIELLLRRVKAELIPELVSKLLKIDEEKSKKIFQVVINTLRKAGVLYREVK